MKIAIVYSSVTGNTRRLAETIRAALGSREIVWCGKPGQGIAADLYLAGSWTDKGQCSQEMARWLQGLHGATLAWFGTAGFGGSPEYYQALYARTAALLPPGNRLLGHFYCQGRMPAAVRARYVALLTEHPEDKKLQVSLANFDAAATHPDDADLQAAAAWAQGLVQSLEG